MPIWDDVYCTLHRFVRESSLLVVCCVWVIARKPCMVTSSAPNSRILKMDIYRLFTGVFTALIMQEQHLLAKSCRTTYINNEIADYRCQSQNIYERAISNMNLLRCVGKCLSMSGCRYINHNQTADQCILGWGTCKVLEPAPGFLMMAFGPVGDACLSWGSSDEPARVPIQMRDGHEMIYVSRMLNSNALIPGKYAVNGKSFWCSNEGEAIGPIFETVNFLTTDAACTVSWMPYTSGAPFPTGAVIGGYLPNATDLYVARVDYGIGRPSFGYYNPSSGIAHYESSGSQAATSMYLLILI